MIKKWDLLKSREIDSNRVFSTRKDTALSPLTGKEHDFYVIEAPDWVNVIAVTAEREIVLIEQYRHGVRSVTVEIPGGVIDPGEAPIETARRELLEETGYREYLLRGGTEEGKVRLENVLELISVAQKYNGLPPRESLAAFLEEVALVTDIDSLDEKENAVTLMTLHTAKGLEYPCVFIAGCEENIFPHSRSLFDEKQLEEERRLMYVGMTRACKKLHYCCVQ